MLLKASENRVLYILWLITSVLTFVAASASLLQREIYSRVITADILPAVVGQDLISLLASILIFLLLFRLKKEDIGKQTIILGLLGYLFYAYGIYVIERVYSIFYYLYLAIFSLSFWTIIYSLAQLPGETLSRVSLPRGMRQVSAGFSLFIALVFIGLWTSQLFPLIQQGQKIEFFYSIYILDLCFIMPAFLIVGFLLLQRKALGILLAPALFILGFTLIFSLAVSEVLKLYFKSEVELGGIGPSLVLSALFLILAYFHLRKMKIDHQGQKEKNMA